MQNKKKVLVVYGGTSTEREISLQSGKAVYDALKNSGYDVELFDLTADNIAELATKKADVIYPVLHGKGGEDGSVQGLFELMKIPYVGSKIAASAICIDKILCKDIISQKNVPTAGYMTFYKGFDISAAVSRIECDLDLPAVVKAAKEGSSIGVYIASTREELEKALSDASQFGDAILVERYIDGIELTVPVIRTGPWVKALPTIEITAENEFYDYEAKYTEGKCHHIIPARIDPLVNKKIADCAVKAFLACGCDGVARVDFMLDNKGNFFVLEINTIPGMTRMSLVPDSAKAAGISFEELVSKLVESTIG